MCPVLKISQTDDCRNTITYLMRRVDTNLYLLTILIIFKSRLIISFKLALVAGTVKGVTENK